MNLQKLKNLFIENGCERIYVKNLSPNDNSKNQVYLAGSFEILNILPISNIETCDAGDWKKERFKASLDFSWISDEGKIFPAPNSQLILYPKYPEVRFSGFLNRCENAPSQLMTQRLANRILFLSVTKNRKVLGFVGAPDSKIANEFLQNKEFGEFGVFKVIELPLVENNRGKLIHELKRIHDLDWIASKKLNNEGKILPCASPHCGGYTLEAELGIKPNSKAEPDFLGWEIKQFGVKKFENINNQVITLMTPEPTDGYYVEYGSEAFIRKYGYGDLAGRPDRLNFGGIFKVGFRHQRTGLRMELKGFDYDSGKIRSTNGMIALFDDNENIAASWSFSSMLLHWNRKHNQACYVPSLMLKVPNQQYKFGDKIILGIGTDFQFFLKAMAAGDLYYDPGIKLENESSKPKVKTRSQFRVKAKNIVNLYKAFEIINLNEFS